ncbi:MAG: Pyridoxal phosphate homeostasis protein [Bacteroidia bacterium]|nr:Pyridoxal phosphate homeostasis protein [Bacteroidia bacterium]
MSIAENLNALRSAIPANVRLVAVSKTKPVKSIQEAYDAGQRIFGENRVQELTQKQPLLPDDIEWHLIGHLQKNKVKYIASFISLIHSVDSLELLETINKEAAKCGRVISCLLQFHIAKEDTKFGLNFEEAVALIYSEKFREMKNVKVCGVMGMATLTDDESIVRKEFRELQGIFMTLKKQDFSSSEDFKEISMGMSGDYKIAIEEGSTLVRIGSAIFRERA